MIDSKNQTAAFRCGRIFAVLERIQTKALGDINATIKDKFFASACATPDLMFTRLIKLAQAHLAKMDKGSSIYYDKLLQEIIAEIDAFPKALSLKQQGDFILGYYQQKQKLFETRITEGENK
jgi:CRISPR-associated protein Csd1